MVPGLTKKPGLLELKPKSQKNLKSLYIPDSLNSPVKVTDLSESDDQKSSKDSKDQSKDAECDKVIIKLSDVNLDSNLLSIKTTCKPTYIIRLGNEGTLKQKAASQRKLLSAPQNPKDVVDFRRLSCSQLKGLPEISVLSMDEHCK